MRRIALPLILVALAVPACGGDDDTTSTTDTTTATATPESSASSRPAPKGANTAEVVQAAGAFLETLSSDQQETVNYDLDDPAKQAGWSNFPTGFAARAGIVFTELDATQQEAALAVMQAALSEQGFTRLEAIRDADAYLAAADDDDGGGPGGGDDAVEGTTTTDTMFGGDNYFIAFFGEPSETDRWTLQFGGHHLAYNLTYEGKSVSLSPTLTATEPVEFEYEGQTYAPLADASTATFDALGSLSEDELAQAEISDSYDDLLLGPQNDGPFPEPEGVLVGDLTADQQAAVEAMLRAWVGDIHEPAAEARMKRYLSEFDETYLGWSGSSDATSTEAYVRLDGPSAWIEFSNQEADEDPGYHHHTIFRDQTADYGG